MSDWQRIDKERQMETVTSRDRVRRIFSLGKASSPDRTGFWMGKPHRDSWSALITELGTDAASGGGDRESAQLSVRRRLGDDFRWISPEWSAYRHPDGKPMFDVGRSGPSLGSPGVFAECESVAEVDAYDWPDPDHLDFSESLTDLRSAGSVYRASGFWSPFFHLVADFFGMDNYFIKMYTHPDVVHAVTAHIVDFYHEANRRFFIAAGDLVDGFFFGNDFGTQLDLLIGPELFREFVFPYFRTLTELGHEFGHQVILHSCGSIYKVIPDLISLGVDALHPLQAQAANMEAERLGAEFGGAVAFLGGVDTQHLLVHATPEEVEADVKRVRRALGPNLVVSPSHEALLPNVPPANVLAMARAAGAAA
jgi:uroporphyrinogen decarboxylase